MVFRLGSKTKPKAGKAELRETDKSQKAESDKENSPSEGKG